MDALDVSILLLLLLVGGFVFLILPLLLQCTLYYAGEDEEDK